MRRKHTQTLGGYCSNFFTAVFTCLVETDAVTLHSLLYPKQQLQARGYQIGYVELSLPELLRRWLYIDGSYEQIASKCSKGCRRL